LIYPLIKDNYFSVNTLIVFNFLHDMFAGSHEAAQQAAMKPARNGLCKQKGNVGLVMFGRETRPDMKPHLL